MTKEPHLRRTSSFIRPFLCRFRLVIFRSVWSSRFVYVCLQQCMPHQMHPPTSQWLSFSLRIDHSTFPNLARLPIRTACFYKIWPDRLPSDRSMPQWQNPPGPHNWKLSSCTLWWPAVSGQELTLAGFRPLLKPYRNLWRIAFNPRYCWQFKVCAGFRQSSSSCPWRWVGICGWCKKSRWRIECYRLPAGPCTSFTCCLSYGLVPQLERCAAWFVWNGFLCRFAGYLLAHWNYGFIMFWDLHAVDVGGVMTLLVAWEAWAFFIFNDCWV